MSRLLDYFQSNFTKNCPKNPKTYIETVEFLTLGAKIIGFFAIPANLFAFYVIIFRTPKFMRHMRVVLLNLKIWSLLIDLVYTVFLIPFVFYPIFAMGYIGIFSEIFEIPSEIQFYLAMCCYGGMSSAGILLFENRQHHMIPKGYKFRIENPIYRCILVIFNAFLGISIMLVAIWLRADSDELKFKFLRLNPCPDALYFSPYTFAVDTNQNEFSISIAIVLLTVTLQYSFFVTHCVVYIYSKEASRYSKGTRKMQKMFLLASFFQICIFFVVIVVPLGVFAMVLTTGYLNQGLLNICNLIIPTIGTSTTIGLIIMYKPYREYFQSIFRRKTKNSSSCSRETVPGGRSPRMQELSKSVMF